MTADTVVEVGHTCPLGSLRTGSSDPFKEAGSLVSASVIPINGLLDSEQAFRAERKGGRLAVVYREGGRRYSGAGLVEDGIRSGKLRKDAIDPSSVGGRCLKAGLLKLGVSTQR